MMTTSNPWRVRRSATSDAAADDQRIAFEVLANLEADRMLSGRKPRRSAAAKVGLFGIVWIENADGRPLGSGLDRRLEDFRTSFIDDHDRAVFVAIIKVDRDLPGDQFGGSLRVALVAAIEPDRILQADAIGNIEMKNGHKVPPREVNARGRSVFRSYRWLCRSKTGNHRRPRHCEKRSDEAIHDRRAMRLDCFAEPVIAQ
jgi:hypothetical protein